MSNDVALIVGSGFDELSLQIVARSPAKTPYGSPSGPILTVQVGAHRVLCLPRHGESHALAPHEINYRANLWALQQHGVRRCVALNVVGAIAASYAPTELAVPHQLIDYTSGRVGSFGRAALPPSPAVGAESGVLHIDFTEPFDAILRGRLAAAIAACGYAVHQGVYAVTQGPRLETAAEVERLARDGCTMVGMTAMPEAALARELAIDYAVCAVAVNYAAGRGPDAAPILGQMQHHLATGMRRVGEVLERLIPDLAADTV